MQEVRSQAEHPVIDCSVSPSIGEGYTIVSHRELGQLVFDPEKIELYIDVGQRPGAYMFGEDLRRILAVRLTLNANVWDFLQANPGCIPESWRAHCIYFWGTEEAGGGGKDFGLRYVRYMQFSQKDEKWSFGRRCVIHGWGEDAAAAVLKSAA